MTSADVLQETYTALSANKARSGLTIQVVIGIASVIAMTAIGRGAKRHSKPNTVYWFKPYLGEPWRATRPGFRSTGRGAARTLTQEDANAIIAEIPLAFAVAPNFAATKSRPWVKIPIRP